MSGIAVSHLSLHFTTSKWLFWAQVGLMESPSHGDHVDATSTPWSKIGNPGCHLEGMERVLCGVILGPN